MINEPTRANSILDLLLCDCASTVRKIHNLPNFSTSDHSVIGFNIMQLYTCSIYYKKLQVSDYKRTDWHNMFAMLSNVNWGLLLSYSNNIQQCWDSFYDILHYAIDTFVPTKNVKILSHRKKVLLPLTV